MRVWKDFARLYGGYYPFEFTEDSSGMVIYE